MISEKQEILDWLYSLHRFGIQPGLERITQLLSYLGNPEKNLKAIHITGTNGKGTTSFTLGSILMEFGYKVGLYTSPHLVDFNERIQINGEQISDAELVETAKSLIPIQQETGATFFELTTAIAFKYFADRKVDFAIIEAGMGGKNDATNVLEPLLSIITPISLEHQEYLGDTLKKIAEDKSGIIKRKSKTLISDDNPQLKDIFITKATENNNKIHFLDDLIELRDIRLDGFNSVINYSDSESERDPVILSGSEESMYSAVIPAEAGIHGLNEKESESVLATPFLGEHQARNVLTALKAFQLLELETNFDFEKVKSGIRKANSNFKFLGRFQIYSENPLIILDVAHNPAAFERLIHNLDKLGLSNRLTLVLALMADKDISGIAAFISGRFRKYIITKPKIERAAEPKFIQQKLLEANPDNNIEIIENVSDAVKYINESKQPTLFAGSFYLIGEVLE